jgi:hypothetical protein
MSCAATQDFTICQGASWPQVLIWKTGDPATAVDITGYTARLQARVRHSDTDAVLSLTSTPAAGITLGTTNGTITLALTAAETAALTPGRYVYDLEMVAPAGTVRRLVEGTITVTPEVTR